MTAVQAACLHDRRPSPINGHRLVEVKSHSEPLPKSHSMPRPLAVGSYRVAGVDAAGCIVVERQCSRQPSEVVVDDSDVAEGA
jgi:hypothetical protein